MSKFQAKIKKQYEDDGWLVIKLHKTNANGIPDLMALKDGVAEFIEIKEYNDTLKPLQKYRIDQLKQYGFKAYCIQDKKGVIY